MPDAGVRLPQIKMSFVWVILIAGVLCIFAIAFHLLSTRGEKHPLAPHRYVNEAHLNQGRIALQSYGCGSCHEIPGLSSASGRVGPSLKGIRHRMFIAGRFSNTPENLALWIRNPHAESAMPDLGVTEDDATNITAYLYEVDDESVFTWLRRLR